MSDRAMTSDWIRERVRLMRELGVVECNGLVLGPAPIPRQAPPAPRSPQEQDRIGKLWDEYRRRLDFAHVEGLPDEPEEEEFVA